MRLRSFDKVDYDDATKELKITGRDTIRRETSITIQIPDAEEFIASLAIKMMDASHSVNDTRLAPFYSAKVSGFNNKRDESWVSFQFRLANGATIRLGAEIDGRSDAEMAKIQAMFEAALLEMQRRTSVQ